MSNYDARLWLSYSSSTSPEQHDAVEELWRSCGKFSIQFCIWKVRVNYDHAAGVLRFANMSTLPNANITSIVCKIFEHRLAHNIHAHMNQYTLLYKHQQGFRAGHSCDTQLLNTVTDFFDNLDNGIPLNVIILDFSKAFDVVSHTCLIEKLPSFGILV